MLAPDSPSAITRDVPEYRAEIFSDRTSRYVVLVFVIIADGNSTDGSLPRDFLAATGVRALLTKTGPGKLSAQMRMGLAFAMDEGYAGVIVVDGNGKDDLSALPEFARLLDAGYDHVQGSRFIPGGHAINTPLTRLIGVKAIHAPLISLASRRRHTDTTNGFRAYSRHLILDSQVAVFRPIFMTYELHYHLAIESSRATRFRTTETPVTRTYPPTGKVPTKITPIRGNSHVLGVLLLAVLGRYRLH
jgi:dolichol-phosphate mannosyltransferase